MCGFLHRLTGGSHHAPEYKIFALCWPMGVNAYRLKNLWIMNFTVIFFPKFGLLLNHDLSKCSPLSLPFIHWFDSVGKQLLYQEWYCHSSVIQQVNEILCFSPLQRTKFSSVKKFSVVCSLSSLYSCKKGWKRSALKYLVTWGQNITSRLKWPSGQIRSQVGICWWVCLSVPPIPGGLLAFWATMRHPIEFFQGHK